MLLGGLWHGANWTFVAWGGVHGLMLAANHAWRAIPLSSSPIFRTRSAQRMAVLITFLAVTLAWVPFRADSLADTGTMLSYLWPGNSDALASIAGAIESQLGALKHLLEAGDEWFKPRELWPAVLPRDYLANETRPLGLLLLLVALATFAMPNTYRLFERFDPALGLPEETTRTGALSQLDGRVAFVLVTPNHAYVDYYYDAVGAWGLIEEWLSNLSSQATVFSFAQPNSWVYEPVAVHMTYWNDPFHFSLAMGEGMLARLAGLPVEGPPDNFMERLTPERVASHVEARRRAVRHWAQSNPQFVESFEQARRKRRPARVDRGGAGDGCHALRSGMINVGSG